MFQRKRTGSTLCPSCGKLVGVADPVCLNCGRKNPGMWGLTAFLHRFGQGSGFSAILVVGTGLLYLATLLYDVRNIGTGSLWSLLGPSTNSLLSFGATGSFPIFRLGRWWTLLSAGWLHAGLLHIGFNLYWVRYLVPETAELYGIGRTVILYTLSSVFAFAFACVLPYYVGLPSVAASLTVGASAPICGLLGALVWYGRRAGSRFIRQQAIQMAISTIVMGFLLPRVNNLAHIGGFLGGYLVGRILDPLKPERIDHQVIALVCLLATAAAIVASLLVPLPAWVLGS
jgi:rhomboid protease GluP